MRISRRIQALAGGLAVTVASTLAGVAVGGSASATAPQPATPPVRPIGHPDGIPVLSFSSAHDLSVTRNPDPAMAVVIGTVRGRSRPQPITAVSLTDHRQR